ncbi:MAG: cold-shock protein [Planctomycetaceae bacterium]|nr:cold-shock protein [Planctomycetaceae bacterium]
MAQGTIKKLMEKGFGFIESGDGEVFFHLSAVDGVSFDELSEGQTVEFESEPGEKGPRATTVRPA